MNRIWQIIILWFWIALQFLNAVPIQNEEAYFGLAKQFMQPEWAPWSFHFSEFPGTRLLFQYISGFFLKMLSFETFAFWSRAVAFLLLIIPLNSFFRSYKLHLFAQLLILQLFLILDQSYFAGGWIFQGFEAKTISYILIFISLNLLKRQSYLWAVFWAAVATCFHVLVGGWFTAALGIYLLLKRENLRKLISNALLFLIVTAPMIYYLASEILINSRSVIDGVNLNEVYVYFRNPHHTGIFRPLDRFVSMHLPGILTMLGSFTISLLIRDDKLRDLKLLFWSFTLLCIFNLILGIFDSTGAFLKFYPFRPAVFSLLFFLMLIVLWVREKMLPPHGHRVIVILLIFIGLPSFAEAVTDNFNAQQKGVLTEEQENLYQLVSEISDEGDVIYFYEHLKWDNDISFIRKTRRERFFVFKFVPGGGEKLYDWYQRYSFKKEVKENIEHLFSPHQYRIDYIISKEQLNHPGLTEAGSSGTSRIYRIQH